MRFRVYFLIIFFILIQFQSFSESGLNKRAETIDASLLDWKLWGYRPNVWRMNFDFNALSGNWAEHMDVPIDVPGSVQKALKNADVISDWNIGTNSTTAEWIENRHWIIAARIPDNILEGNLDNIILQCDGLDYKGIVMVNGKNAGEFDNAFIPYSFSIGSFLKEKNNTLAFVFECPPENLAQIGWTSKIKDWKPRFNYGWDWVPRIVQVGIWDKVWLQKVNKEQPVIEDVRITTDALKNADKGLLNLKFELNKAALNGKVKILLSDKNGKKVLEELIIPKHRSEQRTYENLEIKRWWPNGSGDQPLYTIDVLLFDENGDEVQEINKKLGFRNIEWLSNKGAIKNADPWICSVNNRAIFLQGVNWTPILPNFADLKFEDYQERLKIYKKLGINTIRVWGGGFPEKDWLYDLCDEYGILIWQDFPLSSSGLDNYPPEGAEEILTISLIAEHYIKRLQHHASLLLWCAGNELYERGDTAPVDNEHRLIEALKKVSGNIDPSRKFVNGSPSGPNIYADQNTFGSGNNWDVHGPWKLPFTAEDKSMNAVLNFWEKNDALFHSEVGVPGAMSAEMIMKYRGNFEPLPASSDNPLWRNVNWWIEWDEYLESGNNPNSLEEYVQWSQKRQKDGLSIALKKNKERFPACGGFIIWMGHDCYPCMINTSIIDFEGNLKPAANELSKIWKTDNSIESYKP